MIGQLTLMLLGQTAARRLGNDDRIRELSTEWETRRRRDVVATEQLVSACIGHRWSRRTPVDTNALIGLSLVAVFVAAYTALAVRLERFNVTGPMVFVAIGLVIGPAGLDVVPLSIGNGLTATLAEITLALVLFGDASRIDLRVLRRQAGLPSRLLLIGLPLTTLLGALAASVLFEDLGLIEAALIGAILAPTDAALGQAVINDQRIPVRIRQALNVESGLNDGLIASVFAVLLAVVAEDIGVTGVVAVNDRIAWVEYALRQVGYGVAVGTVVGFLAILVVSQAERRGWTSVASRRLAVLALAVLAWSSAGAIGGNGFIAAFVGGLAAGFLTREVGTALNSFLESEGELLSLLVWMIFGGAVVGPLLGELSWRVVAYAVASLTVVRMVPIALSLLGTGLHSNTTAFLGWFGPRGLASIVYGLAAVETLGEDGVGHDVVLAVGGTVLLSVLAHGITARPLSGWYSSKVQSMNESAQEGGRPEMHHAHELPTRSRKRGDPTR